MNDSSDKIRGVVIPVTTVLTVIGVLVYVIYWGVTLFQGVSLIGALAAVLGSIAIAYSGYIAVALWEAIADIVDNTSLMTKRLIKISSDIATNEPAEKQKSASRASSSDVSEEYDEHVRELLTKRRELYVLFKSDGLTSAGKEEVLRQLKEIDSELKKVKAQ